MDKIATRVILWGSALALFAGGLGGAYAAVDRFLTLEHRVAANTTTIQQDQWFNLNRRKQAGAPLTREQWIRWCAWGKRYRFIETCGRWNPNSRMTPRRAPTPRLWRR